MQTNNGIAITTLITAALALILLSSIFTATANLANAKKTDSASSGSGSRR
jgi:hypothetical protein